MMPTAFVDSDVIIASLLSLRGASYLLLQQTQINLFISSFSLKELKFVAKRLEIKGKKLEALTKNRFKIISLKGIKKEIKEKYQRYVLDQNDAHIVAGAVAAKVKFLLSYNLRHFRRDKIKEDFGIILLTPASFLQYLRSQ